VTAGLSLGLSGLTVNPDVDNLDIPEETTFSDMQPVRPARERHAPAWVNDYEISLLSAMYEDEPELYEAAIIGLNKVQWGVAMREDYKPFIDNGVWKLVERPSSKNVV
jgi:hypothetical protein